MCDKNTINYAIKNSYCKAVVLVDYTFNVLSSFIKYFICIISVKIYPLICMILILCMCVISLNKSLAFCILLSLSVMDANGKYTWGTFSGNKYWVGDANQCRKMENEFVEWQKDERLQRSEELPPFRVSMNSINFILEILKPGLNEVIGIRV